MLQVLFDYLWYKLELLNKIPKNKHALHKTQWPYTNFILNRLPSAKSWDVLPEILDPDTVLKTDFAEFYLENFEGRNVYTEIAEIAGSGKLHKMCVEKKEKVNHLMDVLISHACFFFSVQNPESNCPMKECCQDSPKCVLSDLYAFLYVFVAEECKQYEIKYRAFEKRMGIRKFLPSFSRVFQ